MFSSYSSSVNMTEISDSFGTGLSTLESDMNDMMTQLESNPDPSQADLLEFQALVAVWSNMVQLESEVVKSYGDAMKTVVQNTGN